jgi:arylsulfatase A-like enzyme
MLDDLGIGDVGCYGQKLIRTPNIDRLAAEGIRYTDCYSGAAVCAPARSVLMTGLHGGHTPVRTNAGTIPILPADVTFPQLLKSAGYTCGGFGKWGLGDAGTTGVPWKHGFDEFFGYLHQIHAHSYYPEFLWNNGEKFPLPGNTGGKREQYSANIIAERSIAFLRKNKDRPFFLYATYTLPHGRYEIPSVEPYADRDWPEIEKTYAAMVTRADSQIGAILSTLKELKLEDNTVVFFTSDNGGVGGGQHTIDFFHSTGKLRGQKGTLYEGGIRVPMIVRWPGRIKRGAVSRFPWAFCDVAPTMAEIAGIKPAPSDGISIVPAFSGKNPARESLYWEHHVFDRKTNSLRLPAMAQAARMGGWKAVRPRSGAPLELYNLAQDESESKNVAAAHPEIAAKVDEFLRTSHTRPRPHDTGSFEYAR